MRNYVKVLCALSFLFPQHGFGQKYYEIKFSYSGTLYDVLEVVTKKDITVRTVFYLDSSKYVLSSDYTNYSGRQDNKENYSLLISKTLPVCLTDNRRQPNLVPCYFYRTWNDSADAANAPLFWKLDHHKLRDPENEKYKFNGKQVSYFRKLRKEEVTDDLLERFMLKKAPQAPEAPKPLPAPSHPDHSTPAPSTPPPAPAISAVPTEKDSDEDIVYIQEAQYAMAQKVKDYDAAVNALRKVSQSGQKHRLYTYYASLAYEGLGNYELALANYQKYLNFNPNNTNTINKVAEITYKLHKINPSGSWKDIKSTSGKIFNIELTGTELSIKSADGKVNITLHYTSSGADGAKRYDGFYKVPLERRFKEGSCTICGYPDGLATYCEINGTNSNIHIYTRDLNVSLDGTKAQNGIIKYKACCKSEPAADYAFIYELERNTNQSN